MGLILREFRSLNTNMLLYWQMIRLACSLNLDIFDMGRSSKGAPTFRFKQQWGPEMTPLSWYTWAGDRHSARGDPLHQPLAKPAPGRRQPGRAFAQKTHFIVIKKKKTMRLSIPMPLLVTIDDTGWWLGQDGSAKGQPFRTGMPRVHAPGLHVADRPGPKPGHEIPAGLCSASGTEPNCSGRCPLPPGWPGSGNLHLQTWRPRRRQLKSSETAVNTWKWPSMDWDMSSGTRAGCFAANSTTLRERCVPGIWLKTSGLFFQAHGVVRPGPGAPNFYPPCPAPRVRQRDKRLPGHCTVLWHPVHPPGLFPGRQPHCPQFPGLAGKKVSCSWKGGYPKPNGTMLRHHRRSASTPLSLHFTGPISFTPIQTETWK